MMRQAAPSPITSTAPLAPARGDHDVLRILLGLRRELRRALGDQAVALAHEGLVLREAPTDDDLAAGAEGVGHLAGVANRDGGASTPGPILDPEVEVGAAPVDRAGHDDAGQVVRLAGLRGEELRGLLRLARGAERRVYEAGGEQHSGAERDDQTDLPLAVGVHSRSRGLSQGVFGCRASKLPRL